MAVGLFLLGMGYVLVYSSIKGVAPWDVIKRGIGA